MIISWSFVSLPSPSGRSYLGPFDLACQFLSVGASTDRLDDFDARGSDELTLRRGEKIELVELDDGFGDGWYLGKELKEGTVGLFPGGTNSALPLGEGRTPLTWKLPPPTSLYHDGPQDSHSSAEGHGGDRRRPSGR